MGIDERSSLMAARDWHRAIVNTDYPLAETLDAAISSQEKVCEYDSSTEAWTVLAHLKVMRDDLALTCQTCGGMTVTTDAGRRICGGECPNV